jgi:hypothetical protein
LPLLLDYTEQQVYVLELLRIILHACAIFYITGTVALSTKPQDFFSVATGYACGSPNWISQKKKKGNDAVLLAA